MFFILNDGSSNTKKTSTGLPQYESSSSLVKEICLIF